MLSKNELQSLIPELGPHNWRLGLDRCCSRLKNQGLENKATRLVSSETKDRIEKRQVFDAVNWLSVGLFFDSERTLAHIRREGVLRASKYHFQSKVLSHTLVRTFSEKSGFDFSSADRNYVRSVSSLLGICPAFHKVYVKILGRLRKEKKRVIKTLLGIVDLRFALERGPDLSADPSSLEHYSQEELAEATSFLVYLFDETVGLAVDHVNLIDSAGIDKKVYAKLLVDACKLIAYREAEILVDTFAYSAEEKGDSVMVIPCDAELEKSIRAGYIVDRLQREADAQKTRQGDAKGAMSLDSFVDDIDRIAGSAIVRRVEQPIPRYVLFFPNLPDIREAFGGSVFLQEDIIRLSYSAKDNFTISETLSAHPIASGLVVLDIIKIQRFFDVLRKLMARKLLPLLDTDPAIVLQSILPVVSRLHLRELLSICVDDVAAEAFIYLIDAQDGNKRGVFDLQYQPALRAGDFFIVPLNVLCASDLVRNLLYLKKSQACRSSGKKSTRSSRDEDSISLSQEILALAIGQRTSHVTQGKKWKWRGKEMEVDIVALVGRYLLLVECKDAYHPCNAFELRTSFDHMKKARRQLTNINSALSQPEGLNAFLRLLDWSIDNPPIVITCICSSNRMFTGYVFDGHPVRNIYEMSNFFLSGSMVYFGEETSLWNGKQFVPEDLHAYLNVCPYHERLFSEMISVRRVFSVGRLKLEFPTFGLDISNHVVPCS